MTKFDKKTLWVMTQAMTLLAGHKGTIGYRRKSCKAP